MISPIHDTLIDQLVEIKDAHPVNEEDAIKKLLKKNENFCALVDWVYRFQVPVHHQKYHTKAEICNECALTFEKSRSKRYEACSDVE